MVLALLASNSAPYQAKSEDTEVSTLPRIIGGLGAPRGNYPWMISIFDASSAPAQAHFCGGALIAPNYVLTAAHCVNESRNQPQSIGIMYGRLNLSEAGGEARRASQIIVHPSYSPTTSRNDVALIKFVTPITGPTLRIADTVADDFFRSSARGTILGWGVSSESGSSTGGRSNALLVAQIPALSADQCRREFGFGYDSTSMLCAGQQRINGASLIDSCFGDSGGPLVVNQNGTFSAVGVVSFGGEKCSGIGVYTRVAAFASWVTSVTGTLPSSTTPSPPGVSAAEKQEALKRRIIAILLLYYSRKKASQASKQVLISRLQSSIRKYRAFDPVVALKMSRALKRADLDQVRASIE
jgi:secreted trypsin-like serine protease